MLVRLFILGIVYEHDTHGYEIKATATLWGVDRWASIGFGSIYHAISQLKKERLIVELPVERKGSGPPRYMFRITDEGRAEFLRVLRDTLQSPQYERRDIDLALAFAPNLPPEERIHLVSDRLSSLEALAGDLDGKLQYAKHDLRHVPWVALSLQHGRDRLQAEIDWTRALVEAIGNLPQRNWKEKN